MLLGQNLHDMERRPEAYWFCYSTTSSVKTRWRALTVRHRFHVLPSEAILEIGAGSGLWTEHLAAVFHGRNPITVAVFNNDFFGVRLRSKLPNIKFVRVADLTTDLPVESFESVIGTAIYAIIGERRWQKSVK